MAEKILRFLVSRLAHIQIKTMKRQTNNRRKKIWYRQKQNEKCVHGVLRVYAQCDSLGLASRDEKKQQTIDLSASRDGALNAVAFLIQFNFIVSFISFTSLRSICARRDVCVGSEPKAEEKEKQIDAQFPPARSFSIEIYWFLRKDEVKLNILCLRLCAPSHSYQYNIIAPPTTNARYAKPNCFYTFQMISIFFSRSFNLLLSSCCSRDASI